MNKCSNSWKKVGLSIEHLHGPLKIQMADVPRPWQIGEPMVDDKHFNNNTQTRVFYQWYLQQAKIGRHMFGF
jgi:hypothetical protein